MPVFILPVLKCNFVTLIGDIPQGGEFIAHNSQVFF